MLVGAAYFHQGQALSVKNRNLLASWASAVQRWSPRGSHILGADFNMPPSVLEGSGGPSLLSAVVAATDSKLKTCVQGGGKSSTNIDYFLVSTDLARGIEGVHLQAQWTPRVHRPVDIVFYAGLARMQALVLEEAPKLPAVPTAKPVNQAAFSWTGILAMADAALEQAVCAPARVAMAAAEGLYTAVVDALETEVMVVTDTSIPAKEQGKRGRGPALVWRPLLRSNKDGGRRSPRNTPGHILRSMLHWHWRVICRGTRMRPLLPSSTGSTSSTTSCLRRYLDALTWRTW